MDDDRLFTGEDMVRALRFAHDRAFQAGQVEEGVGLDVGDRRSRPPTFAELDAELMESGFPTFPADEPTFVLRPSDYDAEAALHEYVMQGDGEKYARAAAKEWQFEEWTRDNAHDR